MTRYSGESYWGFYSSPKKGGNNCGTVYGETRYSGGGVLL